MIRWAQGQNSQNILATLDTVQTPLEGLRPLAAGLCLAPLMGSPHPMPPHVLFPALAAGPAATRTPFQVLAQAVPLQGHHSHSAQGTTLVSPPWRKGQGHPLHLSQATFHQILFSLVLGFDICTYLTSYPDALFIHLSHHSSTTSSWTSSLLGLHYMAFGLICA